MGYDQGFVVASDEKLDLDADDFPYRMRINGWGQLRHTILESRVDNPLTNPDVNQIQLKRARLVFAGSAFVPEFSYFLQLDGRSSSGDDMRLLDYLLAYDFGSHLWGLEGGTIGFKTGKYKMPFTMSRWLSGRDFEFTDRSVSSMFFDVNRSLAFGLYGETRQGYRPIDWEVAIFNGLVTGGAETGSSGTLDDNFAYSARVFAHPLGDWGYGALADFECHEKLATRIGAGWASSQINQLGTTEFGRVRVVDSGERLEDLIPDSVTDYTVNIFAVDASAKWRGWSTTIEYYLRTIDRFQGDTIPSLFDHGFWLQLGKFVVPRRLQLVSRWSRVTGDSGTLGTLEQSADEVSGAVALYFNDQHAKLVIDGTYLDGAPINSAALDIVPGDTGWLVRSQIQFAF